jgi:hypothetical protein
MDLRVLGGNSTGGCSQANEHSPLRWALNELMQRARATSAQRLQWLPGRQMIQRLDAAAAACIARAGRLALVAVSLFRAEQP